MVTPFAEKGAVKALGARWDATRKVWYIQDVADLAPFLRWIPDLKVATEASTLAAKGTPMAPSRRSDGVVTRSSVAVACCDCKVLPWDDCEHTVSA